MSVFYALTNSVAICYLGKYAPVDPLGRELFYGIDSSCTSAHTHTHVNIHTLTRIHLFCTYDNIT